MYVSLLWCQVTALPVLASINICHVERLIDLIQWKEDVTRTNLSTGVLLTVLPVIDSLLFTTSTVYTIAKNFGYVLILTLQNHQSIDSLLFTLYWLERTLVTPSYSLYYHLDRLIDLISTSTYYRIRKKIVYYTSTSTSCSLWATPSYCTTTFIDSLILLLNTIGKNLGYFSILTVQYHQSIDSLILLYGRSLSATP